MWGIIPEDIGDLHASPFDFDTTSAVDYNVYCGQDGNIDYGSPVATMLLADTEVEIASQDLPPDTIWHYVRRRVAACALESDDSPVCIVRIDSNGDMIADMPNAPLNLTIEQLTGGKLRLRWRYSRLGQEVSPTGFKIYMDSGSGFNFGSPESTVTAPMAGAGEYAWTSGALNHGQLYRFVVRSYRTDAGESQNTDHAAAVADSQGPVAITGLRTTVEEE